MPNKITWNANKYIEIVYDASGNKWRKIVTDGVTKTVYDYFGGIEYKNGNFDALYHPEGRVTKTATGAYRYEYTIKDHLGNGRVYFTDINGDNNIDDSDILQEQNYYAFGAAFDIGPWYGSNTAKNKYQYNGKEYNDDFGLNLSDYGARWYDANVGRFFTSDPLATVFNSQSPYVYAANRPINMIDFMGMGPLGADNFSNEQWLRNSNPATHGSEAASTAWNGFNKGSEAQKTAVPYGYRIEDKHGNVQKNVVEGYNWVDKDCGCGGPGEPPCPPDNSSSNNYNIDGVGLAGLGLGIDKFGTKMYSQNSWYSFSAGKSFNTSYYGYNLVGTSANRMSIAKNWSRVATGLGRGLGAYQAQGIYTQWKSGEINTTKMVFEQSSNLFSTIGGLYGAAWGVGWELGRAITKTNWYHQYIFLPVHPGGRDGLISTPE